MTPSDWKSVVVSKPDGSFLGKQLLVCDSNMVCRVVIYTGTEEWLLDKTVTHWQEVKLPRDESRPLSKLEEFAFVAYDYNETILYRSIGMIHFARVSFSKKTYSHIISITNIGFRFTKFPDRHVEYRVSPGEAFGTRSPGDIVNGELCGFNGKTGVMFFPSDKQKEECCMYALVSYDEATNQFVRDDRDIFLNIPDGNPTREEMWAVLRYQAGI